MLLSGAPNFCSHGKQMAENKVKLETVELARSPYCTTPRILGEESCVTMLADDWRCCNRSVKMQGVETKLSDPT